MLSIFDLTTLSQLPMPWHRPITSACIKTTPEDFVVNEVMPIEFTDAGEHLWLQLQKTGMNTDFVAGLLAKWASIPKRDVGFSGLKDRHAVTTQWFSLRLPMKQIPAMPFAFTNEGESAHVLTQHWHNKKLNRGTHTANQFSITLKEVVCADNTQLEQTLENIRRSGVPNYFGEQRFGHSGNNLMQAIQWFKHSVSMPDKRSHCADMIKENKRGKKRRKNNRQSSQQSLWLSAARSAIFNQILAQRVCDNTWQTGLTGEVFNLAGSGSVFVSESMDETLHQRLQTGDIHPTAALWGTGMLNGTAKMCPLSSAWSLEQSVVQKEDTLLMLATGLEHQSIKPMRRALRLMLSDLNWQWYDEHTLCLEFTLPTGSFATTVLASVVADMTQPRF